MERLIIATILIVNVAKEVHADVSKIVLPEKPVTRIDVSYAQAVTCGGFDDSPIEGSPAPPFLMVPVGGTNLVRTAVSPTEAASRVQFAATDPAGSVAQTSPGVLTVGMTAKRPAQILAKTATSGLLGLLQLDSKNQRPRSITIQSIIEQNDDVQVVNPGTGGLNASAVCVSKGPNGFRDTIPSGDDAFTGDNSDITAGANGICQSTANSQPITPTRVPEPAALKEYLDLIWGKQANINISVTKLPPKEVNYDLNRSGSLTSLFELEELAKISNSAHDPNTQNTIFYVKNMDFFEGLVIDGVPDAFIRDDHPNTIENITAHEFGHLLGLDHITGHAVDDPTALMRAGTSSLNPCRLYRPEWDITNP